MYWVNRLLGATLDGIYPQYCSMCRLRSHTNIALCVICQHQLSPNTVACSRCALPLPAGELSAISPQKAPLCGHCQITSSPFDRVIAPWLYDEQLAYLLHRWKYQKDQRMTPVLAYLWASRLGSEFDPPDLLIPVPLHWRKFWHRGWNQSELLTLELRRQSPMLKKIELGTRWVQRHRATAPQATLGASQRKANMLGAFTVRRRCDNLRVAIIDDVLTTGATAGAMANALRDAGASGVDLWCIARTPEPQD
ncbi:MAG: ComF family protein [Halioglobus sp.]|jgi:ComF family protein